MINNHNVKCLLVILSCINNYILIILKSLSWYFPIKFCRQKYHYYLSCSYSFNYVINNSVIPRIFHGRIEITVKNYGMVMCKYFSGNGKNWGMFWDLAIWKICCKFAADSVDAMRGSATIKALAQDFGTMLPGDSKASW